jgi:hypothetical protein
MTHLFHMSQWFTGAFLAAAIVLVGLGRKQS